MNQKELIDLISKLTRSKPPSRNLTNNDLFGTCPTTDSTQKCASSERIVAYRMQGEYGPKKFIKPWRTGTKSQQQIAPKGHNKGFRGKTKSSK